MFNDELVNKDKFMNQHASLCSNDDLNKLYDYLNYMNNEMNPMNSDDIYKMMEKIKYMNDVILF